MRQMALWLLIGMAMWVVLGAAILMSVERRVGRRERADRRRVRHGR